MIELKTYIRKPFPVQAVLVTEENMEELAAWCKGEILTERRDRTEKRYIKVPVKNNLSENQTKARSGYWLLFGGKGFKVYTSRAFNACFEEKVEEVTTFHHYNTPLFNPPECVGAGE